MNRKEAYDSIKLANNGYTKVSGSLKKHADVLVKLGKVVYIAPNYVSPVEVAEIPKRTFFHPCLKI